MLNTIIDMRPPGHLRDGLVEFIDTLPDGCVVIEVGSYKGEAAELFLRKAARVYCVDAWKPYTDIGDTAPGGILNMRAVEKLFDRRARDFPGRIIKVKAASPGAARLIPDFSADCDYIDANHTEVCLREDIRAWIWKVRPGGVLAGHDYGHMDYGGVKRAVDAHFGKPDRIFQDFTWMVKGGPDGTLQRILPRPVRGQPLSGPGLV